MPKTGELKKVSALQGVKICEDLLFQGLGRESILEEITKKYKASVGIIDKWIKKAKPAAEDRRKEAEAVRLREMDAANVEALKTGLKSDLEIEALLCQFAFGGIQVSEIVGGVPVLRGVTPIESLKAIDLLFKKRGSNAPVKSAQTDKSGNDVVPPLTSEQYQQLINKINAS